MSATLMDVQDLDLADGSFDLALCGFVGWAYCYDFVLGEFVGADTRMQEIRRVLRDGGRVGFTIWERQEDIEWLEATLLWHFPSLAPQPGRETVYSKENAKGYVEILRRAGFRDLVIISETADCVCAGKAAWWEQMREVGWDRPFEKVEALGPDRLPAFKEAVFEGLERHRRADGIHFAKSVSFVFGTKYPDRTGFRDSCS